MHKAVRSSMWRSSGFTWIFPWRRWVSPDDGGAGAGALAPTRGRRRPGPLDPVFHTNEIARGFLHVFTAFLNLWQSEDFGASLDRLIERVSQ